MAIEKSAVREGTRWSYLGREVEVAAVAASFVVFHPVNRPPEVAHIDKFASGASDPAMAEYEHLLALFGSWGEGMLPVEPEELSQAISYLLTRLGPPAPLNPVPRAPAPKPAPVVVEPDEPLEDYAVAIPALPEEGEPLVSAYGTKKRRF
ncbi:hypothetical protein ASF36_13930 [Methylobacterium sp. Leaf90]|nr:hypothetical protein ASF36_13930 [Methylobacterium sp. Leaf90]